jgi:hypothetical protein
MPWSPCRFIKQVAEFVEKKYWDNVPNNTRGIYALLNSVKHDKFDVVYVGMAAGRTSGMYARFQKHLKSKRLRWTHFTVFEVHDNITPGEIAEIEGLFRHMYRKDSRTNKYNRQLCHKPFQNPAVRVSQKRLKNWPWAMK